MKQSAIDDFGRKKITHAVGVQQDDPASTDWWLMLVYALIAIGGLVLLAL